MRWLARSGFHVGGRLRSKKKGHALWSGEETVALPSATDAAAVSTHRSEKVDALMWIPWDAMRGTQGGSRGLKTTRARREPGRINWAAAPNGRLSVHPFLTALLNEPTSGRLLRAHFASLPGSESQ